MDKILGIIIKPVRTIKKINGEEPLFSGMLVFALAVIVANFSLVRSFMVDWQAGIFNVIALIFMWGGALLLLNLVVVGVQKILNPVSSSVLDVERYRKLTVTEFYISAILLLRPLLGIIFSPVVVWVILSAWAIILAIAAVSHLWEVTEVKSALSVIGAVIIIFLGGRFLDPTGDYHYTGSFEEFKKSIESAVDVDYTVLGFDRIRHIDQNRSGIIEAAGRFIEENPSSVAEPYALLTKAAMLREAGDTEGAARIYRLLVTGDETPPEPVYKTAMIRLSEILPDREYHLLPIDITPAKFRRVLRMWRLPVSLSYYRGNMDRVAAIKDIIETGDLEILEVHLDKVVENFRDTDFMDDMLYWAALRYEEEQKKEKALQYYSRAAELNFSPSPDRLAVESVMGYVSHLTGTEDILLEQFRAPASLLSLARIRRMEGDISGSLEDIDRLLKRYPAHGASARGLELKASIYEEKEEFRRAAEIYGRIIKDYPLSDIVPAARHRRDIIKENLDRPEILAYYVRGLFLWRQGRSGEAIDTYREIVDNFSGRELARRLQFNIALYYRGAGNYMQALREFRQGYESFPDTDWGFECGLMVSEVLSDDLGYPRRGAEWLVELTRYYEPDFESQISGRGTSYAAFKAADIAAGRLRDYRFAVSIYESVAEGEYRDADAARAIYEKSFILEDVYSRYSDAVSGYRKIVSDFPRTEFTSRAAARIEEIHEKGVKHLDRFY